MPCGKEVEYSSHGQACVEGYLCDTCREINRLTLELETYQKLMLDVKQLTNLIVNSPTNTKIAGDIDSHAYHLGRNPLVSRALNEHGE